MTELNNVCACARLWRRNPILSFVRDDLFCSFDVLVSLVFAKIWTLERNGFNLIFKFTYRNNKKYSTWHVNWRGRSYLWWFAKLECMLGTRGEWASNLVILLGESYAFNTLSSYEEQISILRNDMTAKQIRSKRSYTVFNVNFSISLSKAQLLQFCSTRLKRKTRQKKYRPSTIL